MLNDAASFFMFSFFSSQGASRDVTSQAFFLWIKGMDVRVFQMRVIA
jgi:hypothetical protein